jgi:hypothetical protein
MINGGRSNDCYRLIVINWGKHINQDITNRQIAYLSKKDIILVSLA